MFLNYLLLCLKMKKWFIVIVLLILSLTIVSAYSKDVGLKWFDKNIDWTKATLQEFSLSFLALKLNNYDVSKASRILGQRQDDTKCFPRGNCNVIDTSFALLALNDANQTWLDSTLTKAQVTNWYIQINTQKSGTCIINFEEGSVNVTVNGTNPIQPYDKNWISVEDDLKANLDKPFETINVNCNKVNDPSTIISLIRIVKDQYGEKEFYIIKQESGSNIKLTINNACYPSFIGGQCDKDSSLYASWVLNKLNKDVKVLPYLEDNANANKDYAILYSITKNEKYAQKLIDAQSSLGYWDNQDIFVTSLAINALKSNSKYTNYVNNATKWLEDQQVPSGKNEGSFGSILNTAAALYLVDTEQIIPNNGGGSVCGDNIQETGEECDGTADQACPGLCDFLSCTCKPSQGNVTCSPDSLKPGSECSVCNSAGTAYTDDNFKCKVSEECKSGACLPLTSGATCGNNLKETGEDCDGTDLSGETCESKDYVKGELKCTSTCRFDTSLCETSGTTGPGTWFWIGLIVIILILGGGGYFAYNKFFKKGKPSNQPEFLSKPSIRPPSTLPSRKPLKKPGFDESIEHELDKSIKEAEKLLRK